MNENLFRGLDKESCKEILFKAIKKGGKELADKTKVNLRRLVKSNTPNRWNGKTMESGIRLKADKDYCEVSVNIMGDFRLKIFEKGNFLSPNRPTKKGYSRGNIKALNFFSDARLMDLTGVINNSITESLNRVIR